MRNKIFSLILILFLFGCTTTPPTVPPCDEVLIYDKPFDYTYLKVLEAVDGHPDWSLYETDKEKGMIAIWNERYGSLFDEDTRRITLLVRRVDRRKTSVELAPYSQTVIGGKDIMKTINAHMSQYAVGKDKLRPKS